MCSQLRSESLTKVTRVAAPCVLLGLPRHPPACSEPSLGKHPQKHVPGAALLAWPRACSALH